MHKSVYGALGAGALALLGASLPAHAASVSATVGVPASVTTSATAEGCSNNPGPFITLTGEIALGGINGRLIFRNNVQGTHTHTEDVTVDVVLLPAGERIRFAKQPPEGGVGGNPRIFLQFVDAAGNALSDEMFLGRCVQGLATTNVSFPLASSATVDVTTGGCENNPGPFITLSGEIKLGGINARLIFKNNVKGTHTHEEPIVVDVVVLPADESITFAKQPPLGGVGGNPRIYFQFTDASGNPLGAEIFVGRCVQLD